MILKNSCAKKIKILMRGNLMSKIANYLKKEILTYKILLRNIPSLTITLFILSVICANLMANKELFTLKYLALDCGYVFSWIMFLCMDIICKRYGSMASIRVSLLALLVNLCVCGIFFLLSLAPGHWGAFYTFNSVEVNTALNSTFAGSWYVVFGSALAFLISSVINSLLNVLIGRLFKSDGFKAFAVRSYVSTFIGQYADNFIFSFVVSKTFFGWSWMQVIFCSLTGALFELLCEVIFSPLAYKVVKGWEKDNVGKEYLDFTLS